MSPRPLSASEISQFTFCRRAWWYARQGEAPRHPGRLRAGEDWHRGQARLVLAAGCLRTLGYGMLVAAVGLAAAALTLTLVR